MRACVFHILNCINAHCNNLSVKGPNDALGISIAGGKGSPLGDIPIFIAMIQASGVAARTHKLKVRERENVVTLESDFIFLLLLLSSPEYCFYCKGYILIDMSTSISNCEGVFLSPF